jgi:YD repeat-containing protein
MRLSDKIHRLGKVFILVVGLIGLATAGLSVSPQGSQPPDSFSERLVGPFFPRWLPMQLVPQIGEARLALDGQGVGHAVFSFPWTADSTPNQILYVTSHWEYRSANGWSEPITVYAAPQGRRVGQPDIAVDREGNVHFVWVEEGLHVYYRRLTAQGWAGLPQRVLEGQRVEAGPGCVILLKRFLWPTIAVGADGTVHLIVQREEVERLVRERECVTTKDERALEYYPNLDTQRKEDIIRAVVSSRSPDYPLLIRPRLVLGPGGELHVLWIHRRAGNVQCASRSELTHAFYSVRRGNAWSNPINISGNIPLALERAAEPQADLSVDTTGRVHFVFAGIINPNAERSVCQHHIFYGTLEQALEQVSIQPGLLFLPRIAVDSRIQPHIIWGIEYLQDRDIIRFETHYAAKVRREPDGLQWGFQTPMWVSLPHTEAAYDSYVFDFWPGQLLIDSQDVLWAVSAGVRVAGVTRTYEPNLGEQDAAVMFNAGPNSSVNVANGNLFFSLPLFSSRGAGFATNLSLIYNSLESTSKLLSPGWQLNYQLTLTEFKHPTRSPERDWLSLQLGDGRVILFRFDPGLGYFVALDEFGYFSKIERITDGFLMTTKFGIKYLFNAEGKLVEIRDTQQPPNQLIFAYDDNPNFSDPLGRRERNLVRIEDSMGRSTLLTYDAQNRLQQVTDPGNKTYTLAYNTVGKLEQVSWSGPPSVSWKFAYHATNQEGQRIGLLSQVFTPRGARENFSYDYFYWPDKRLSRVREPREQHVADDEEGSLIEEAAEWRITYRYLQRVEDWVNSSRAEAIFTNRRGHRTTVEYEYWRSVAGKITDALNHSIVRHFAFSADIDPQQQRPLRNLIYFRDKRGALIAYTYYRPEELPPGQMHIADNLKGVYRPKVLNAPQMHAH